MGYVEIAMEAAFPRFRESPYVVTALISTMISIWLLGKIKQYYRLSHIPGPRFTGFSGIPHGIANFGPAHQKWYTWASETFGPLARIAPNICVTSSPELWMHVTKSPDYKRSDWFYHAIRLDWEYDNVITNTDIETHDFRRKQMVAGYTGKENKELEPSMNLYIGKLLKLIRTKYISSDSKVIPLDLADKIYMYNLDVISGIGLGKSFCMLDADEDIYDYAKSTEEGITVGARATGLGLISLIQHPWVKSLVAPSVKDKNGFGKMMATCYQFVDERASNPTNERSDMLASWIRNGLHGPQLRSEALQAVLAGSDTTSSAIRGTLLCLASNPLAYAKLQQEIDEAIRDGKVPPTSDDGIVSAKQVQSLPYLQACIREGLRTYPPVTGAFARDVPKEGDNFVLDGNNVYLPGGTSIAISAEALHHNKDVYGDDVHIFRPERWFEPDQDKLARMVRVNELSFGAGRFQCLGKGIALMNLHKVVYELVRNFDMVIINAEQPWHRVNRLGLWMIHDFWVQIRERKAGI